MHLKSILNRVERRKCFVYREVRFVDGLVEPELEVEIEPRANSRAICSGQHYDGIKVVGDKACCGGQHHTTAP